MTTSPPTVTFVPNDDAPFTTEERIRQRAERLNQDPDNVVAIPFSELEGNLLYQVPSHLVVDGVPVPVDIAGDALIEAPIPAEPVTELGEELANELDSFETPGAAEVVTSAAIIDEGTSPVFVVDSEETMDQLEKKATGDSIA